METTVAMSEGLLEQAGGQEDEEVYSTAGSREGNGSGEIQDSEFNQGVEFINFNQIKVEIFGNNEDPSESSRASCTRSDRNILKTESIIKEEVLDSEPHFVEDLKVKVELFDPLTDYELEKFYLHASSGQSSEIDDLYQFPQIQNLKKEEDSPEISSCQADCSSGFQYCASTHSTTLFPCVLDNNSQVWNGPVEKFNLKPCQILLKRIGPLSSVVVTDEIKHISPAGEPLCPQKSCLPPYKNKRSPLTNISLYHPPKCRKRHKFSCEHCKKIFPRKNDFYRHVQSKHPSKTEKTIMYTCAHCKNAFLQKDQLKRHIRLYHMTRPEDMPDKKLKLPCKFCNKTFSYSNSLVLHLGSRHQDMLQEDSTIRYQCDFCKRSYSAKQNLWRHVEFHHLTNPQENMEYACKHCQKTFLCKQSILNHLNIHFSFIFCCRARTGENKCTCDYCQKVQKANMGKFSCAICNKVFTDRSNLNRHSHAAHLKPYKFLRNPRSQLKYQCEVCGLSLCSNYAKKLHFRRHHSNDPRPEHLRNSESKQRYIRNEKLLSSGLKLFKCKDCGALFTEKFRLNRHVKIHQGIKYSCLICEAKYSDSTGLRRHTRRKHKVT